MRSMVEASGKPVVAYVDEQAASAAYWIAAGVADAIYVPPTGRVGSIGCLAVHVDESGAAEQAGLRYTIIRDPAGKAAGSPLEPLTDVGRARLTRDVGAATAGFVAAVSARRNIAPEAIRGLDGDMLAGDAAVAAGLADGVSTLERVIALAAGGGGFNTKDITMKNPKAGVDVDASTHSRGVIARAHALSRERGDKVAHSYLDAMARIDPTAADAARAQAKAERHAEKAAARGLSPAADAARRGFKADAKAAEKSAAKFSDAERDEVRGAGLRTTGHRDEESLAESYFTGSARVARGIATMMDDVGASARGPEHTESIEARALRFGVSVEALAESEKRIEWMPSAAAAYAAHELAQEAQS